MNRIDMIVIRPTTVTYYGYDYGRSGRTFHHVTRASLRRIERMITQARAVSDVRLDDGLMILFLHF
jgi:hypothetical protein